MPAPGRHQNQQRPLALLVLCVSVFGCGPQTVKHAESKDEVILIASERSSRGGRLVRVSSDGARQSALTILPSVGKVLDRSPVFSPDRKWVVFASNRDRSSLAETSLWVVSADGQSTSRLTSGDFSDRDPRVSHDGKWLYFCSNREGSFDLFRMRFAPRAGKAEVYQVTAHPEQVLSPSLSPDDSEVVYMRVDARGRSSLWTQAVDQGKPRQLSQGPTDMTPSWGPTGRIAFAAKAMGRQDADLYTMSEEGGEREVVVSAPSTDETGPRWSQDGRYLFAIGMYRSAKDGKPLLGSVVFADMADSPRVLRALHDPSAVESRIGLAIAPLGLPKTLNKNALYKDALQKVLLQSAVQNEKR